MNYIKSQKTFTRLFLFFVISVFLVSCNEENIVDSPDDILSTESSNSYLDFETKADYAAIFQDKSNMRSQSNYSDFVSLRSLIESYQQQSGARSLSTALDPADTIYEDYGLLSEILNADKVVKIGEYLMKVDLHNETVAVLPVSYQEQYDDLVNDNYDNENIMLFSTEDEVLTLLGEGFSGTKNAKLMGCDSPTAKRDKDDDISSIRKRKRLDAKVVYQKAGIYFSLVAKGKTQRKRFGVWFRYYDGRIRLAYDCKYGVRCGRIYDQVNTIYSSQGKASDRPYEDIKGLEYYFLRAAFYSTEGNIVLQIRDNW